MFSSLLFKPYELGLKETSSKTNQAVQPQKLAKGMKLSGHGDSNERPQCWSLWRTDKSYMSGIMRKPAFGCLKPGCIAREHGQRLEITD